MSKRQIIKSNTTLFCSILRYKGIPARCRCGFALYLAYPGYFEDHWICEYWKELEKRWIRVDPQIDPFQQSDLGIDPKKFNLDSLNGLWFVRGNLLRDFAALNKVETEPFLARIAKGLTWSPWRLVAETDNKLSTNDYETLDKISELSMSPDTNFVEIRNTFHRNEELRPPVQILCNI